MRSVGMPFTPILAREVSPHTQPDNNPIPMSIPHFHVDPARSAGKRILSILPALALVVTLAACDSNGGENFNISTYAGEPYTGEVEATATTPDGEVDVFLGANASVEVDSLGEGEAGFTITHGALVYFSGEGSYDANGATFLDGENELEIEADGDIIGNVAVSDLDFSVDAEAQGRITSSTVDLEVFAELVEGSENFPAGTEVRVVYTLDR